MPTSGELLNFINNEWRKSSTEDFQEVINPATGETIGQVPFSLAAEVDQAAQAAQAAFEDWWCVPVVDRVQYLWKLKNLLEENIEDLARMITMEAGKTFEESVGEMRRTIENTEVAAGMPTLIQGDFSEDIAQGIDEIMMRQPVGVTASICPFNFPAMIAFFYLPYAIAAGNTFILKPSERTPITQQMIFELIEKTGLPKGVANLVNGGKEVVDAILDHPVVRGVTFVGSTPVAKHVYARAATNGKRVQAQGGAKNPIVIMPDADMEMTARIVADSAFGCAGQRCLAASIAVTVGEARHTFNEMMADAATSRVVGYGLDADVQMGPVITKESRERIEMLIQKGEDEGASLLVDGRHATIKGYENGNFVRPTILQDVQPTDEVATTEIFGPVLSLIHVDSLDEAIEFVNKSVYGNMACLFTSSGTAARQFRHQVQAGNVGVNVGVAAPMAFYPLSGWKESFFGTLHGQGKHAVEFFTQTKVVVERWPRGWSRKF